LFTILTLGLGGLILRSKQKNRDHPSVALISNASLTYEKCYRSHPHGSAPRSLDSLDPVKGCSFLYLEKTYLKIFL